MFIHPADSKTAGSGYGYRKNPFSGIEKFHAGIDYKIPTGTPVKASEAGKIIYASVKSNYGNCIIIEHTENLFTLYGHLSKINVSLGQEVNKGDIIGLSGNTGLSTGSHLHFEFRNKKTSLNPTNFLQFETPFKTPNLLFLLPIFYFLLFKKK